MNLSQQEHSLGIQIGNISRILDGLEAKLAELDAELASQSGQRVQYNLLSTILGALDQLDQVGAADLFWDRQTTGYDPENQLRRVRNGVIAFERKIGQIEDRRSAVQAEIDTETHTLRRLNHELADVEEEAERLRHEFPVYRDPADIPYRALVMPWTKGGEDDRRYRKIFLLTLLFSFTIGTVLVLFKPAHEKKQEEVLPEHIAELVVKKKEEPKPAEKKKPQEKTDSTSTATPRQDTRAEARQDNRQVQPDNRQSTQSGLSDAQVAARASAQTKGVLAHRDDFAGLIDSNEPAKMGAEGRVSSNGVVAPGAATTRALIVSNTGAGGGSGGINTASISRNGTGGGYGGGGTGTGGGGNSITGGGVKVARIQSGTGGAVAEARATGKGGGAGAGPSRSDEEIQLVFDRYKAALYRIYNRELRNDPTLRGKMILRLTIEPDGHVSACTVKSTDMASATLSAEIVDKVLKINFGPKAGVPAATITYPIEFLPAG